jgi:tRNA (cmo5U34)-methyltransferase
MLALDGSAAMRERTRATCGAAADRLTVAAFDLAARDWRAFAEPPHAIVSSLAIHHLDSSEKRALFRDLAAA